MKFKNKIHATQVLCAIFICAAFLVSTLSVLSWATTRIVAKSATCGTAGDNVYCNINEAVDACNNNDTVIVYAVTSSAAYVNAVTITRAITVTGKTSAGADAWTSLTAGSAAGAPELTITRTAQWQAQPIISIRSDDVTLRGLTINTMGLPLTCTAFTGGATRNNVSITYCDFNLGQGSGDTGTDTAVSVDGTGNKATNLAVSYCGFTGQTTSTSNWFKVGNGGTGGSVDKVSLTYNSVTNAMSVLDIDAEIKNVLYSNNTFSNAWTGLGTADYGYFLIDKTGDGGSAGHVQGITLTHNTFNEGSASAPSEFAVLVADGVAEADAGNDWSQNLAIHFNNILQKYDTNQGKDYPIIGFETLNPSTQISATHNWWGIAGGPKPFSSSDTTAPSYSSDVDFAPWVRGSISGGRYSTIDAGSVGYITDTQNSLKQLIVTTGSGGAASLITTKFAGCPTGTAACLTSGQVYFDLLAKSGRDHIDKITATFSAGSGSPTAYWYTGSTWKQCSQTVSASDVTLTITQTGTSPTISNLTRTFFGLAFTTSSSSSSSSSSSTTTSTSSSATTSSVTPTSTTTTSTGGSGSGTTTSAGGTATTTTTSIPGDVGIRVTPSELDFSDNESAKALVISNTGTDTLSWEIDDNDTQYDNGSGWIFSVVPKAGQIDAIPESVTVTVSRRGTARGTYSAWLPVTSNGGNVDVGIVMETARREFPAMALSPPIVTFLAESVTETELRIRNPRGGTLTWELESPIYHRGEGWIAVSPVSGFTQNETDRVRITVDRGAVGTGLYSATLPIRSNASDRNLSVIMLSREGPRLRVSPALHLFLGGDATEKTLTVSNTRGGTLAWEIGQPEYVPSESGNWIIAISPAAGSLAGNEEEEVTITIDRTGLGAGIYRAKIPVTSNGGNKTLNVLLITSLL